MTYTFQCTPDFRDGDVGKIVLYHDRSVIDLGVNSTREYAQAVAENDGKVLELELANMLGGVGGHRKLTDVVGEHPSIRTSPSAVHLGGTSYAVKGSQVLIVGTSGNYGQIHAGGMRQCLAKKGLELVTPALSSLKQRTFPDSEKDLEVLIRKRDWR